MLLLSSTVHILADEGPSQTEKSKSIEKTGRGDYVGMYVLCS